MASDLTKIFDISRQTPSGHSIEELRQNYFIQALMQDNDDASIAGIQINQSGRVNNGVQARKKQQQAINDMLMLDELERQLAAFENYMMKKYGEDFAEQFAAQLLDEKTFNSIMKIEDEEKRRREFAKKINEGISDGSISPDKITNPDFKQWLDINREVESLQKQRDITLAENKNISLAPEQLVKEEDNTVAQDLDNIFKSFSPT